METKSAYSKSEDPADHVGGASARFSGHRALICSEGVFTYGQLGSLSLRLSSSLFRNSIRSGMTLAVSGISDLLLFLLLARAPRLGITLFPLNPELTSDDFRRLLVEGAVDRLISAHPRPALPPGIRRIDPAALLPHPGETDSPQDWARPLKNDDVCLIVATSGTTTGPRGVMLSCGNLDAAVQGSRERIGLGAGDLWLNCLPRHHIGGLSILYRCAAAGAAILSHDRFDPAQVLRDLKESGVTHISLVPAMLSRLLETAGDRPCPASCKVVLVGGGALHHELAVRALDAGWPLCVSYGLTETASQCATDCGPDACKRQGWVGRPLAGVEVGIWQPAPGGLGRIRIRGPAVMAGYANPEKIPGIGLEDGWFLTSDLGCMDASGQLRVLGRVDDVLVSGGENVHPDLVEARLRGYPGVMDVAVSARQDNVWGDRLVAIVVGKVDLAAMDLWARTRLAGAQRPREYLSLPALPRNTMGKLDRQALRRVAECEQGNS